MCARNPITLPLENRFLRTLVLLVVLNLLVKPVWVFAIDRRVQNLTGFESYGAYYAMFSFCFLFSMILDPGLNIRVSRDAASSPSQLPRIVSEAIGLKLLLILGYWAAAMSAARAWGIEDWGLLLPVVLLYTCASFLTLVRHIVTGAQLFRQDAWISVVDKTLVIAVLGPLLFLPRTASGVTIQHFVWVQIAALAIAILIGMRTLLSRTGPIPLRFTGGMGVGVLKHGFPFAVNTFLMGLVSWPDGFLLERLHPQGAAEAGLYAAGYRLMDAFGMLGSLVGGSLLSYITGLWSERKGFDAVFVACRKVLVLAAILLSVCMFVCPSYFAGLLYHREDASLVSVMGTVMLALPALYVVHMQGTLLTATGHIRSFIRVSLVAAAVSLALKLLLLPTFGALSSAWICVGVYWSYAAILVLSTHLRLSSGIGWLEFLLHLMSALGCYGLLKSMLFAGWTPLPSMSLACTLTALVYAQVGGVRLKEVRQLLIRK